MSDAATAAAFMDKARRALSGARLLLDAKDTEGACSRAYYAMFDAARAALLSQNADGAETGTKTHRGLIAAFGKHLVLSGRVEAELGRSLNAVQSLRMTADYIGEPPSLEEAAWAIEQAESFIEVLRARSIVP